MEEVKGLEWGGKAGDAFRDWGGQTASSTLRLGQYAEAVSRWMESNGVFSWVPPSGGFLSFPSYDLDIPSWDLCIRLLEEPYRTYLIPGSCYGYEGHVRFGFGPSTPLTTVETGMRQIDRFVADYQAERPVLAATA